MTDDFFEPWEQEIESFDQINGVLQGIFERWVSQGRQFAWRGMVNASWPLHSSLYRRLIWTRDGAELSRGRDLPNAPDERALGRREAELLAEVHRWELHHGPTGRLSILAQLATLQHFGAPTRLVDVSLNAYIGLWFAVEQKVVGGVESHADKDGRLFGIDITERLINEDEDRRRWEDDLSRPWKNIDLLEWSSKTWAWRPAPFQARIASQHGAFLFGGVPRTNVGLIWPKTTRLAEGTWGINDVRRCISLPLRVHKADPEAGGVAATGQPVYTFRIKHTAKADIRERLHRLFAYSHPTMYPDYPGFASFGTPDLYAEPPRY